MNADYIDMLKCLNKAGVDYIMVEYGMIFQIGVAPCRVDIISKISGVNYADAVTRAVPKMIDGVPVRIISLDDLIANKKASGRAKDIADVEVLEGLRK